MHKRDRVLIIGLDGVPYDLIERWAAAGHLPHLSRLMTEGASGRLASTMPPTSGPAWTSFATGKNPGKTGIYDFLYRRDGSYVFPPVNTTMRSGKTLWTLLSERDRKVGIVNLPISYPVESINGVLVSGWMTPYFAKDFTHPPELAAELDKEVGDYRIYPAETFAEGRRKAFFEACDSLLEMLTRANLHVMRRDDYDLFVGVYFDTDRILHQLWHYLDTDHPWNDHCREDRSAEVLGYFQRLDRDIGRLLTEFGEDGHVVLMSDHGMGRASRFIVLNNLLMELGFLALDADLGTRLKHFAFRRGFTLRNVHRLLDRLGVAKHAEYKNVYSFDGVLKRFFLSFLNVDWARTRAYSYGRHYGSVFLNVKGREPLGSVARGAEYERTRREVEEAVLGFVDPELGRPLVARCIRREEVYEGDRFEEAPDLILLPHDDSDIFYGLSDFGSNRVWDQTYRYSGMHRDNGLLVARGPGVRAGLRHDAARLVDLAPTVLYWMGLEVPADMDGRPLTAIMSPRYLSENPVRIGREVSEREDIVRREYDDAEEEEIMDRLRDLGYMN